MSPTAPPWSRWTIAHAGLVTAGLVAVPVLQSVVPLFAVGALSLVVFTVRHGRLSLPNALTLLRLALVGVGLAVSGVAGVVALGLVWALDGFDGALARRRNEVTAFGAQLDLETDALFVATLGGLLVTSGVLGAWAIGFGLIRSLYVLTRAARPAVAPVERRSTWGRWIFGFTVAALLTALMLGPGLPALVAGLAAAVALSCSFAPDYRALGGTKGTP